MRNPIYKCPFCTGRPPGHWFSEFTEETDVCVHEATEENEKAIANSGRYWIKYYDPKQEAWGIISGPPEERVSILRDVAVWQSWKPTAENLAGREAERNFYKDRKK